MRLDRAKRPPRVVLTLLLWICLPVIILPLRGRCVWWGPPWRLTIFSMLLGTLPSPASKGTTYAGFALPLSHGLGMFFWWTTFGLWGLRGLVLFFPTQGGLHSPGTDNLYTVTHPSCSHTGCKLCLVFLWDIVSVHIGLIRMIFPTHIHIQIQSYL